MLAGEAGPFSPPNAREVLHRPHGRRDAGRDKGADGGVPESAGVRLVQRRLLEEDRQHPLHGAPQAQGVRINLLARLSMIYPLSSVDQGCGQFEKTLL